MFGVRKTVNPIYGYYHRSDFYVYYERAGNFEVLRPSIFDHEFCKYKLNAESIGF